VAAIWRKLQALARNELHCQGRQNCHPTAIFLDPLSPCILFAASVYAFPCPERPTTFALQIDEYFSSVKEAGTRYLKWSFGHLGKSLDPADLRFGYVMKFTSVTPASSSHEGVVNVGDDTEGRETEGKNRGEAAEAEGSEASREGGNSGRTGDFVVEWQYCGHLCSGSFQASTKVFVLNFQVRKQDTVPKPNRKQNGSALL
jgi:hypothetical protein